MSCDVFAGAASARVASQGFSSVQSRWPSFAGFSSVEIPETRKFRLSR